METIQAALYYDFLGTPSYFWLIFVGIVITLLTFDLGVLHKTDREIGARESFILYGCYMTIAFLFGAWVWWSQGSQSGLEFFTGYLIEQSLSMDNILVEFVDLIFAVDSVPAIFAITTDTFIVYTSNIFAILGLRSLYFALASAINRFAYLPYSLATLLVLVGTKVFLVPMGIKIPTALSLGITVTVLSAGILYSLWKTRGQNLPVKHEY